MRDLMHHNRRAAMPQREAEIVLLRGALKSIDDARAIVSRDFADPGSLPDIITKIHEHSRSAREYGLRDIANSLELLASALNTHGILSKEGEPHSEMYLKLRSNSVDRLDELKASITSFMEGNYTSAERESILSIRRDE